MPLMVTALMMITQAAATIVTAVTLETHAGATSDKVAVAAGTVPETMDTACVINTDQPAKKPRTGPKARLTQAKDAPAFGSLLFKCRNARAVPNMMSPQ